MTIGGRLTLIMDAEKYSAGESHDIAKWLCGIRDFEEADPFLCQKIEKMLRAFINRKRMGEPVTTKHLEEEFGIGI